MSEESGGRDSGSPLGGAIRDFVMVFVQNGHLWIVLVAVLTLAVIPAGHVAESHGSSGFFVTYFAIAILASLFTPRMSIDGRPIGFSHSGAGYRAIRRLLK